MKLNLDTVDTCHMPIKLDVVYGYYEDFSDGNLVESCWYFKDIKECLDFLQFWQSDGHFIYKIQVNTITG